MSTCSQGRFVFNTGASRRGLPLLLPCCCQPEVKGQLNDGRLHRAFGLPGAEANLAPTLDPSKPIFHSSNFHYGHLTQGSFSSTLSKVVFMGRIWTSQLVDGHSDEPYWTWRHLGQYKP